MEIELSDNEGAAVDRAVTHVQDGGAVVVPTETSYLFGVAADQQEAVQRLFRLKGRPANKPVSVAVPSIEEARTWGQLSPLAETLVEAFWPGPLTLVVEPSERGRSQLAHGCRSAEDMVALRCPNRPFILKILTRAGRPLTATSANVSGDEESVTVDAVRRMVRRDHSDWIMFFNAGDLEPGPPSTIVQIIDARLKILRPGPITAETLAEFTTANLR